MKRTKKNKTPLPITEGRQVLIDSVLKFLPDLENQTPFLTNKELFNYCHPFMADRPKALLKKENEERKFILKIVDSCFKEFASNLRKEAREKAIKLWYNKFKNI